MHFTFLSQARSQNFMVAAQMEARRLQGVVKDYLQRAQNAEFLVIKAKAEASCAQKAAEASNLKLVEVESKVEVLSKENKELKDEVHLCRADVNALTKRVENSDNLQRIASSALEVANREKADLVARVEELKAEA